MKEDENKTASYRFGPFELGTQPATLVKDGAVVALPSQPLRLLLELVRRRGEIVTHDDIHALLWPGQNVDVTGRMHACIRQIRRALDDDNGDPRYIETVPRTGYRFLGEASLLEDQQPPRNVSTGRSMHRLLRIALAASVIVAFGWWLIDEQQIDAVDPAARMPSNPFLQGRALLEIGDFRAAAERLAIAIAEQPDFAPAYAARSEASLALGDPVEALALAERAITLDKTYARGYLQKARVTGWSDRDWPTAERNLELALELTPDAPDIQLALAELYLLTGRQVESAAMIDALRQSASLPPRLLAAVGRIHRLHGRHDEGEMLCQKAASAAPELIAANECLYRVAVVRRDVEGARGFVADLAFALGASKERIASFKSEDPLAELQNFERWRLTEIFAAPGTEEPVGAAYSNIMLRQYDEAMYLLLQARDRRSEKLPAALYDLVFIGLFHQSAYTELCQSVGVTPPGSMDD